MADLDLWRGQDMSAGGGGQVHGKKQTRIVQVMYGLNILSHANM